MGAFIFRAQHWAVIKVPGGKWGLKDGIDLQLGQGERLHLVPTTEPARVAFQSALDALGQAGTVRFEEGVYQDNPSHPLMRAIRLGEETSEDDAARACKLISRMMEEE